MDKAGRLLRDLLADNKPEIGDAELTALDVLWEYRATFAYPMTKVNNNLRHYVKRENAGVVTVAQRHKRMARILEKLSRYHRMRMSQMQDVGGCRAILQDQATCYAVLNGLTRNWEITSVDDYADDPRDTGYRALHVVTLRDGRAIEVQLRTHGQQTWADEVERLDGLTPHNLKDGEGPEEALTYTRELAELISDIEAGRGPNPRRGDQLRTLRAIALRALRV